MEGVPETRPESELSRLWLGLCYCWLVSMSNTTATTTTTTTKTTAATGCCSCAQSSRPSSPRCGYVQYHSYGYYSSVQAWRFVRPHRAAAAAADDALRVRNTYYVRVIPPLPWLIKWRYQREKKTRVPPASCLLLSVSSSSPGAAADGKNLRRSR